MPPRGHGWLATIPVQANPDRQTSHADLDAMVPAAALVPDCVADPSIRDALETLPVKAVAAASAQGPASRPGESVARTATCPRLLVLRDRGVDVCPRLGRSDPCRGDVRQLERTLAGRSDKGDRCRSIGAPRSHAWHRHDHSSCLRCSRSRSRRLRTEGHLGRTTPPRRDFGPRRLRPPP